MPTAPALTGNGRHAYVRATTAPSLPVTIDSTHNQFGYGGATTHDWIIASGTYSTIQALADAVNAAIGDEDNTDGGGVAGAGVFSSVCVCSVSRSDPTKLLFTAVPAGVVTLTFTTGVENDCLARLIVTTATAMAGGDPVD